MLSKFTHSSLLTRRFKVGALLVLLGVAGSYATCAKQRQRRWQQPEELMTEAQGNREFKTVALSLPAADQAALAPSPTSPAVAAPKMPARVPNRKIIRNGSFSVSVKSFEPFFEELKKRVAASGGFIAQVQANRGSRAVSSAQIVVRVLPDQVDAFTSWLREQGTVTSEQLTGEDVTEQYFDLQARLQNARRFESRLLEMLRTQTGQLQDVVLVEEKLNQIREQIEQFEGKVRLYDNLAGLATLTLSVRVEEHYAVSNPPTFGQRIARAWRHSVEDLQEFLEGLALAGVTVAPWMPLLSAAVILVWMGHKRLLRGWRKKRVEA